MYRQPPHQRISRSYVFPWHHRPRAAFWFLFHGPVAVVETWVGQARLALTKYRLERAYLKPSSRGEQ